MSNSTRDSSKRESKLEKLERRKWAIAKEMDETSFTQMSFMAMWAEFTQVTLDIYYLESAAEGLSRAQAKKRLYTDSQKIENQELTRFLRTAK